MTQNNAPLAATGIRLKVPNNQIAIDELEVNPYPNIDQNILVVQPEAGFTIEWDGNNGDHGLKMSISTWYYTILLPPVPKKAYIYPVFAAIFVIGLQFWVVSKFKKGSKK